MKHRYFFLPCHSMQCPSGCTCPRPPGWVCIRGVDKVQLLWGLWAHKAKTCAPGNEQNMAPPTTRHLAEDVIRQGFIEYYWGMPIFTNLDGWVASPVLYDRDIGAGAFASVLENTRL